MPKYAQLRIDWNKRDFQVLAGMEGDSPDLPFADALAFVAEEEKGVDRHVIVYWTDVGQLSHYGVDELVSECLHYEDGDCEAHLDKALPLFTSQQYVSFVELLSEHSVEHAAAALTLRPPTPSERISLLSTLDDPDGALLSVLLDVSAAEIELDAEVATELLSHPSSAVRLGAQRLWARQMERGSPAATAATPTPGKPPRAMR